MASLPDPQRTHVLWGFSKVRFLVFFVVTQCLSIIALVLLIHCNLYQEIRLNIHTVSICSVYTVAVVINHYRNIGLNPTLSTSCRMIDYSILLFGRFYIVNVSIHLVTWRPYVTSLTMPWLVLCCHDCPSLNHSVHDVTYSVPLLTYQNTFNHCLWPNTRFILPSPSYTHHFPLLYCLYTNNFSVLRDSTKMNHAFRPTET